ncbi:SDR family oxidoreductase [Parendozoicomonas haliclonae]|uniref:UDP-glucose 4-epimerase n=1 Tax=Parendozoicomonas haliclonae TaxID=1960125 RepID=A0A1X7AQZ5_9GAMM|nr:SDR family oxidoreductase [Parendozoicomonas haliclonae]SMA49827.1 UDP-glucose 4-epimerase [Parendozoicomonas haliclonae]
MNTEKTILITGAAGYIGLQLGNRLTEQGLKVIGTDIRDTDQALFPLLIMDICSPDLAKTMTECGITHVIHLASIVEPSRDREHDYRVDVLGTRNVLEACTISHVRHLTVTSSGAAYGYYADNPEWISESDALRGNKEFSYSDHKRQVEEMLASYRQCQPQLKQLILRPGTVLGATTSNMITRLFEGRALLAVQGSRSPFVFIWDQDLVRTIEIGVTESKTGIFNMAGDGALTIYNLGDKLNKPVMCLAPWLIKSLLWLGQTLRLTPYGPEQINFLRYRPVLSNKALKETFGYTPEKTSAETFDFYLRHQKQRDAT